MITDLPIIQQTYDLILWYVPILNRLPRDHKFALGDRIVGGLYSLLEELALARYAKDKLRRLEPLNGRLDLLCYQTRLLNMGFRARRNGSTPVVPAPRRPSTSVPRSRPSW